MLKKSLSEVNNEDGSLVVAMAIIAVVLIMAMAIVTNLAQNEDITSQSVQLAKVTAFANSGLSNAIFQLDQFPSGDLNNIPTAFCGTDATGVPVSQSSSCPVTNTSNATWSYSATGGPATPNSSRYVFNIVSTGYLNGQTRVVKETVTKTIMADGFTGLWGLDAAGNIGIVPSNPYGVPNPSGIASAGMNSGAVACGGLITNEGTIDVYGLASGSSNPCGVTPNGLPPLNPGNVSVTCPAPATVPATPCLPPLSSSTPSNYITGCSPSPDTTTGLPYHDSCCPASNTFSGTMSSGIYICNGPTVIDVSSQDFTVAGGSTAPNNGVLQIYVFNGTAGANDLTIQGSYGVNVNTSTSPAQNGNSEDLQIFVSNTSTPNCSPNSSGTGITGGGYIAFTTHGSNVPQISVDLYAPNDSMTVNGAPFSSWVGQVLVCYASFKGGGNGKATMYSDTNKIASYTSWVVSGYKD